MSLSKNENDMLQSETIWIKHSLNWLALKQRTMIAIQNHQHQKCQHHHQHHRKNQHRQVDTRNNLILDNE